MKLVPSPPLLVILGPTGSGKSEIAHRVAFERNGFVGGFARSWRRTGPLGESRLVATVFEFSTARGAKTIEEYESGRTVREDGGVLTRCIPERRRSNEC